MLRKASTLVAIVDDDSAVLDSLCFLLEVAGHDVVVYTSALSFLQDRSTRPACLILDHHMPQMSGLDLVARLRKEGNALRVALITGAASPAIVSRAFQLGVNKVLEKPVPEDELLRFVEVKN